MKCTKTSKENQCVNISAFRSVKIAYIQCLVVEKVDSHIRRRHIALRLTEKTIVLKTRTVKLETNEIIGSD